MLALLKTTKDVLGNGRIPSDSLEAVHATMREAKAEIDALLGHTEGNLFRTKLSLDKSEEEVRKSNPYTLGVISHILKEAMKEGAPIDLSSMSLTKNSVMVKGQEQRLSKVISKYMKGKEDSIAHCMKELKIAKPEQFLPKLGDIVKSGRALWLSTNILDYLTASDNAAFRSCHSMDGQHYNGNIAYCRDKMTLLSFVSDASVKETEHQIHKLGRSWMFVVDDKVAQAKSYGALNDAERKLARNHIIEMIAKKTGTDPSKYTSSVHSYSGKNGSSYVWEKPLDRHQGTAGGNMAAYFDSGHIEIAHAGVLKALPKLEFAAAACLVCGCTTDYPKKGVCSEHDGHVRHTCAVCGERHRIEHSITVNGEHYCRTCYAARFASCNHCNQHFRKEEIVTIDGHRVCPACQKKHYVACGHCGKSHRKEKLTTLPGVKNPVCNACIEEYLLCSVCNLYHPKAEVVYHQFVGRVCGGCINNVATRCAGCGEYHMKESINAEGICAACDARRKGEDLVLKAKPKYAGLPEGWEDYIEEIG